MNKNQKIALGCGGAGCLGLIVLVIVGVAIWVYAGSSLLGNTNFNSRSNTNANANANRSLDNSNSAPSSSSDSDTSERTDSSSMSDEDKHRLFQAAGMTRDSALIQRVLKKIGLFDASGNPTAEYEQFVKDHFSWATKNTQFVMSVNDEAKARAYVNEHLDD